MVINNLNRPIQFYIFLFLQTGKLWRFEALTGRAPCVAPFLSRIINKFPLASKTKMFLEHLVKMKLIVHLSVDYEATINRYLVLRTSFTGLFHRRI